MQRLPSVVPTHVRGLATAVSRAPLSSLNTVARAKAEQITAEWKGTNASGQNVKNYIGGKFTDSKADKWIDLVDPVRPHSTLVPWGANGYCNSQRKHCFPVSQKRLPRSSSRPSNPQRKHSRPGVALPFSHDSDSFSSMNSRFFPFSGLLTLLLRFQTTSSNTSKRGCPREQHRS